MKVPGFFLIFFLYLFLPLIPIALFLQTVDKNLTLFLLVSRSAGIYAFIWYSLQFIVTSRNRMLERLVAQDRRMLLHMFSAIGLLLIVVVHTSFGNEKYLSEIQAAAGGTADVIFLWATIFSALFFSNYFIRFLPTLVPYRDRISEIFKLTHERCLLLHYAMPVGMVVLICHIILIPGPSLVLFKTFMVMIASSALLFYLYHKTFVPRIIKKHPWKVAKVVQESDSVVTLYFDPPSSKKFNYYAGQFCYISLMNGSLSGQWHPFTLSSGPEDERVSITVKQLGDFTASLKQTSVKDLVCIDGAYGKFSYTQIPSNRSLVFIAGGIGITPFISMLEDLSIKDPLRKIILIWGARHETDLIRLKDIQKLSERMEYFVFEPVLSRSTEWNGRRGRFNKTLLMEILKKHRWDTDLSNCSSDIEFFICGPAPMITDVLKVLKTNNVSGRKIHLERFAF